MLIAVNNIMANQGWPTSYYSIKEVASGILIQFNGIDFSIAPYQEDRRVLMAVLSAYGNVTSNFTDIILTPRGF